MADLEVHPQNYETFAEFLDACIGALQRQSFAEIKQEAESSCPSLMTRIKSHVERRFLDAAKVEEARVRIASGDALLASFLIKEPSRQGVHERAQIRWIKQYYDADVAKPRRPMYMCETTKRVVSGGLKTGTKSIDAISEASGTLYTMKHTESEGGSQDNQFADIQATIRAFGVLGDEKWKRLVVCIDGKYYTDARKKVLRGLADTVCAGRVVVMSAQDSKRRATGSFHSSRARELFYGLESELRDAARGCASAIEPFSGGLDLVRYACASGVLDAGTMFEAYDLTPVAPAVYRDTLTNPPDYTDKFVITNPPYLAANHARSVGAETAYLACKAAGVDDAYKVFIRHLIKTPARGVALVLPLGFISSYRVSDAAMRREFFSMYDVRVINVFEKQMFEKTACPVVVFAGRRSSRTPGAVRFRVHRDAGMEEVDIRFGPETNWTIEDFSTLSAEAPDGTQWRRLLESDRGGVGDGERITGLHLDAIDGHEKLARIEYDPSPEARFYGKDSSRARATIVARGGLRPEHDEAIARAFNEELTRRRKASASLWMPAFREFSRKRLPFDIAYRLLSLAASRV